MPLHPDRSPGFLLWHVTLRWQREMAAALTPLGLTHVQFVLLATAWWLGTHEEKTNQLTLATRAGTDVKMTSQVLRRLEDKGLISRTADPADTRAKLLRVTAQGAELAQRAIAAVEAADAAFFAPAEGSSLLETLTLLADQPVSGSPEATPVSGSPGAGPGRG